MSNRFYIPLIIIMVVMSLACSGSGSDSSPVTPEITSVKTSAALYNNSPILWGTWEVRLDPDSEQVDIVPLRTLDLTTNVTCFMQPPLSSSHLLGIAIDNSETDWAAGYVVVDISFRHPFPGLDTYTGFDVRGVCIGNGSHSGYSDSDLLYAGDDDLRVVNADGYTRWYNPDEFTTYEMILGFTLGKLGTPAYDFDATLNGYKYFCDWMDVEDDVAEFFDDPSNNNPRGYFSAGQEVTRRYEIQFGMNGGSPDYAFQYAVVASWENPDPDPPENIPDDFPLSANCQEAYAVSVVDQSTMYYTDGSNNGGFLSLDLAVYDHQGSETPMGVHDQIARIHIESPDGLISGNYVTFEIADLTAALIGYDETRALYSLVVPEGTLNLTASGDFPVLISVESANPSGYDQGFEGVGIPDGVLAAYYIKNVHVYESSLNEPPVAVADTVSGIYTAFLGVPMEFTGEDSYDPDGTVVSWDWDFDEDGIFGDESGEVVSWTFDTAGVYDVDLEVTDDFGATDTLDTKLEITVIDKVIHVDDDNTTGPWDGTVEHPYEEIPDGIAAVPDDTGWKVYVHEGNYTSDMYYSVPSDVYSPGGMIWMEDIDNVIIEGEDGARIIALSNYYYQKGIFRIRSSCSDIIIDNFEIYNRYWYQAAIWAEGFSGLTVRNCEIVDPGVSMGFLEFVRTSNVNEVLVQNNEADSWNSASTFMNYIIISGGTGITVTGNDVYNMNNAGGHNIYQTGEGYIALYNATDVEISKNKLGGLHHRSCSSSNYVQSHGISINNSSGCVIRNNLIYDTYLRNTSGTESRNWGIRVYGTTSNVEIYNNTIDTIGPPAVSGGTGYTYGIRIENSNTHTIHSNIISNITATVLSPAYGINTDGSLAVDYSCIWSITGGTVGAPYGGAAYAGTGSILTDPMYTNPSTFDYTLQSGSPCEGTGMNGDDMGAYGGSDPLDW